MRREPVCARLRLGVESRVSQQGSVVVGLGIRRCQQLVSVEDRIRTCIHGQELRLAR